MPKDPIRLSELFVLSVLRSDGPIVLDNLPVVLRQHFTANASTEFSLGAHSSLHEFVRELEALGTVEITGVYANPTIVITNHGVRWLDKANDEGFQQIQVA